MRSTLALAMTGIVTTLALAAPASAQPLQQKRAEVRQRVAEWGMQQITQDLQLDPAQVPRFREIWSRYAHQIDLVNKATGAAMRELKAALAAGSTDEARLRQLADDVVANRRKVQDLELQRTGELRAILSATQFARGVVIAPEIRKQLHERMQEAMHGGPAGE